MRNDFEKIDERFGVAEPTLFYVDPILDKVTSRLHKFIKGSTVMYKRDVVIKYPDIRPNIGSRQLYAKFPVVGIELELDLEKLSNAEYEKKYSYQMAQRIKKGEPAIKKALVYGSASGFGNKNWSGYSKVVNPIKEITDHGIILNISIGVRTHPTLDMESKKDAYYIMEQLKLTIWHELNHAYESYNLLKSKKGRPDTKWIKTAVTYASLDSNSWKFPKFIYDFWEDKLTYYMYFIEPYEIRAEIQEIAYSIEKSGFGKIENSSVWKEIAYMEKFDPDKFYQELLKVIAEYPKYVGTERAVAKRLKDMWITVYKNELKSQKQIDRLDLESMEKMKCLQFIKMWDERFKEKAKYMKRKIYILASHKKTEGGFK